MDDSKLIQRISRHILNWLISSLPSDCSELVGMDDHMGALESLLSVGSNDEVRMIGICGMGGIGKTTVARHIYKKFSCHFQACCFVDNVKGIYGRDGPAHLQKYFLSKILRHRDLELPSSADGSDVIKATLGQLTVLVVLDDVDNRDQLNVLAAKTDWFGAGSRIVVTSRDTTCLFSCQVYEVKLLKFEDAIQLFSQSAFGRKNPEDGFLQLSTRAAEYAGALPLALRVLGSYLGGMSREEWETALFELERSLHGDIMKVLEISYEGLDEQAKAIFLYIACFFYWDQIDWVAGLLDARYSNVKFWIKVLAKKSLVEVSSTGSLIMHDLLRQMGRELVRLQSPDQPGKRKFLFDSTEIQDVLTDAMGTETVEGISLDMSQINDLILTDQAFKRMPNLRVLNFYGSFRDNTRVRAEGLNHLPRKLVSVRWVNYPLCTLPSGFRPDCLVELLMPHNNLESLWEEALPLRNVKKMDLCSAKNLKRIPDLSLAPNLEELDLSECDNLVDASSIQSSQKLARVLLEGCKMLECLPSCHNMKSLEHLNLSNCSSLKVFPQLSPSIKVLRLRDTAIEEVPSSIKHLVGLVSLDVSNCKRIRRIPSDIENLTELETLDLESCELFTDIPKTIQKMKSLKTLRLSNCKLHQSVPELPRSLKYLVAHGCFSLTNIAKLSIIPSQHLLLSNCFKLAANPGLQQIASIQYEEMGKPFIACLPGCQVPEFFSFRASGSSLTLIVPQHSRSVGFIASIVVATESQYDTRALFVLCRCCLKRRNGNENLINISVPESYHGCYTASVQTDHLFLFSYYFEKPEEYTEMVFEFSLKTSEVSLPTLQIKECGLRPIFTQELVKQERNDCTASSSSSYSLIKRDNKLMPIEEPTAEHSENASCNSAASSIPSNGFVGERQATPVGCDKLVPSGPSCGFTKKAMVFTPTEALAIRNAEELDNTSRLSLTQNEIGQDLGKPSEVESMTKMQERGNNLNGNEGEQEPNLKRKKLV